MLGINSTILVFDCTNIISISTYTYKFKLYYLKGSERFDMKRQVHCVIMGGGRGTRLYPLTKLRCKPAVPLAGKYRLVDIPISNCINSGFNKIYLLSQFNTAFTPSCSRRIQV